jgi:hypothetical protein
MLGEIIYSHIIDRNNLEFISIRRKCRFHEADFDTTRRPRDERLDPNKRIVDR